MPDEGPSFLTTPPTPPDPDERRGVPMTVASSPFRTPGEVPQPRASTPAYDPRPPRRESPRVEDEIVDPVGDAAGEHLIMSRGRYSAWFYVVLAFALEAAAIGAVPRYVLGDLFHLPDLGLAIGIGVGVVCSWLVFRDRWRCIEAFSSRFCSGIMNLSIFYVPLVAFVYANVRGASKLRR